MRRYSNATILSSLTVRDTPSIAPPFGGLQRSSIDDVLFIPIQAPASRAMSAIVAFAGSGNAISSGWR